MVTHIVMWKLKDASRKREDIATLKRILEALEGRIPGLLRVEVGVNYATDASACDAVLFTQFTDRAALEAYQSHPEHKAVVPTVKALTSERHMVDYEA